MADNVSKKRITELEKELAALKAQEKITATQDGVAAGQVAVGGDVQGNVIIAKEGARIVIGEEPILLTAVERESALGRYLTHVISRNRYLQLQGIRSGGKLVNIELDRIYITLHTARNRPIKSLGSDRSWTEQDGDLSYESADVKIEEALRDNLRMVVLGDPGSGKTTLMRYLALCYARDRAEGKTLVRDVLRLNESGYLPILLPLRNLGAYLAEYYRKDDGAEGHSRLLDFLRAYLKSQRINLPDNFFDSDLESGKVVMLLDGMDEVGDVNFRRRVIQMIDSFATGYPNCRIVVTSRIVGYAGEMRLSANFATTTVRDFTLDDVEQFLSRWHLLVSVGQMGGGESAETFANSQTIQLLEEINSNTRIRELATNPLMLTVIALIHRDRVKLPDRRAELYAEAVNVLLGTWDEARGINVTHIFDDHPLDANTKRTILQNIALKMHEDKVKEINDKDLGLYLFEHLSIRAHNLEMAHRAVERFIKVIEERSGLLVNVGPTQYRFSHLTFQEYLAALAIDARKDYLDYILAHDNDLWWREVILLAIGHISSYSLLKTTDLIQRIADDWDFGNPYEYYNLILAMEALHDIGAVRAEKNIVTAIQNRVKKKLESGLSILSRLTNRGQQEWIENKGRLIEALVRSGSGYWSQKYGEPEWIFISAGEFIMGDDSGFFDGKPAHKVFVEGFKISRVPITNAQYSIFVETMNHKAPPHWIDGKVSKNMASHPVVNVSWNDADAYCAWLSQVIGSNIRLPTEAEWEKAARGTADHRTYPWGKFDSFRCNSQDIGSTNTSPVGVFPKGASPYGCLDMVGNVWEWCGSKYSSYPYSAEDGRENMATTSAKALHGGAWTEKLLWHCRISARISMPPYYLKNSVGFRCVNTSI